MNHLSIQPQRLRSSTLLEALSKHARAGRELTLIEDDVTTKVPYAQIEASARALAGSLVESGVTRGEVIPMVLPTGLEFVVSFFGILMSGATPSPLGPPAGFGDIDSFSKRTGTICRFLKAKRMIVSPGLASFAVSDTGVEPIVDPLERRPASEIALPAIAADDMGLVQCTSGSTGVPKGVVLSHTHILSNVHQIGIGVSGTSEDVVVAWLPLNHDMGLIGSLLFSIYWGMSLVLLSPVTFLRKPSSWLKAISDHRGTLSPAPNFAYAYACARTKEPELAGIDLSSWRVAFCGAEPIAPHTMRAFQERFASAGLRENVILPCYGLAEACLAVTFRPVLAPLVVDCVDRDQLALGEVCFGDGGSAPIVNVVSCGRPLIGTDVAICDRAGNELDEMQVGRIMVRGPSVMRGYLDDEARTKQALSSDGWLWTGDLGYMRDGQLFITGREKDVIILRGKNFVPSEFEWAAEEVPGVRRGNAVAFGVTSDKLGTEMLVIACETDTTDTKARDELKRRVVSHVMAQTGIRPDAVHLLSRERLPKTTSGKLQRSRAKQAYVEERPSVAWRVF
jgi:acyl-CoA synthetase (AMP-forming)/AMP-acid ligase II